MEKLLNFNLNQSLLNLMFMVILNLNYQYISNLIKINPNSFLFFNSYYDINI